MFTNILYTGSITNYIAHSLSFFMSILILGFPSLLLVTVCLVQTSLSFSLLLTVFVPGLLSVWGWTCRDVHHYSSLVLFSMTAWRMFPTGPVTASSNLTKLPWLMTNKKLYKNNTFVLEVPSFEKKKVTTEKCEVWSHMTNTTYMQVNCTFTFSWENIMWSFIIVILQLLYVFWVVVGELLCSCQDVLIGF